MKRASILISIILISFFMNACSQGADVLSTPPDLIEITTEEVPISTETDTLTENNLIEWIQIELITTSDWADLFILNPDQILSYKIVSTTGGPTFSYGGSDKLTLEQPIAAAKSGASVGITVNFELTAEILAVDFRSLRGNLNENQIRIFALYGSEIELLMEINHDHINDVNGLLDFSLVLIDPEPVQVTGTSSIDLVYFNGTILTMEDGDIATAIAIKDEFIHAVGSDEVILELVDTETITIDLEGRTLMPGFVDTHSHIFNNPWRDNLEEGQDFLLSSGVTSTAELFVEESLIQDLQLLDQQGKLRVRVSLYPVHVDNCGDIRGDWYSEKYPVSRESGAMMQIPGVKMFNDGGSCNKAAVSYARSDMPGFFGDLYFQVDELAGMIVDAQNLGYQVAIHGLGDRAIEVNLDAIEIALDGGSNIYRHRIEHNSLIREDLIPRYSEVNPVATLFAAFPTCRSLEPESPDIVISPEGTENWSRPWRSLIDNNPEVHFAWHSDNPYTGDPVPLTQLQAFVTRIQVKEDGTVCEPPDWAADDLLSVEEALRIMTIEGAYALLREHETGSLTTGKLADLIILSDNPLEVDPRTISDLQVLMTMVGGEVEYCSPGAGELCPDLSASQPKADLIYHNGVILTMEDGVVASAIAVKDEIILAVGNEIDVLTFADSETRLIDLNGHTLMPGFVDPHSHVFNNPWRDDLEGGQELLLSNGITTTAELFVEEALILDMKNLEQQGKLRMRVSLYPVHVDNCGEIRGDWYSQSFPVSREPGAMLQIPGIKVFNDGGTCNAPAVSFYYESGIGQGDLYFQPEELSQILITAQNLGYQVAIHSSGDRAVESSIQAITSTLENGSNTFRHRIEHNVLVRDDLISLYTENDIVALLFGFFPTCWYTNDFDQSLYATPDQFKYWRWRWRDLIDANPEAHFAWHSDSPYLGNPAPMEHLFSYVTRSQVLDDGTICEPPDWVIDDLLTAEEALPMMTIQGAYAILRDEELGSLKVGKLADLIILSENPLEVDPYDILNIRVLMTMIGGELEFCLPSSEDLCP